MGPTGSVRAIQIHPTRKCNLNCLHCYSSSGPEQQQELSIELLRHALDDASREGYDVVSLSGGEPLMYPALPRLLAHAKSLGMRTTLTSNSMLWGSKKLEQLKPYLDLIAISLDGIPRSHNRIRNHPHAFSKMKKRLGLIRDSGIPFGFIFTLTQYNLHELEWVARFAYRQGAKLLQIHPLAEAGHGKTRLVGSAPDNIENGYAYLLAEEIQRLSGDEMKVQLDLMSLCQLRDYPERVYAGDEQDARSLLLSDLVSPLIIDTSGDVLPMQYGFSRHYAIGNLHQIRLRQAAQRWKQHRHGAFRQLCRHTHQRLCDKNGNRFVNWYEELSNDSKKMPLIQSTKKSTDQSAPKKRPATEHAH